MTIVSEKLQGLWWRGDTVPRPTTSLTLQRRELAIVEANLAYILYILNKKARLKQKFQTRFFIYLKEEFNYHLTLT